jgi:hypothetical protein
MHRDLPRSEPILRPREARQPALDRVHRAGFARGPDTAGDGEWLVGK